jgi:iron complex transport system ATP-binding protein
MTANALIEIERATIYRGDTCVFRDFSLAIGRGEQVAIVGPNGAGKTTLLKLINRELYPVHSDTGGVRILGKDKWNVWDLRKHIGVVSDDLQTRYPQHATGLDVVLSGFFSSIGAHGLLADDIAGEQRSRAARSLADFGVADYARVPLSRMSTGQRRRCLLARAMVHRPHTLILDEPTAGLDLAASFDYLSRVRRMIEGGTSIVLVTHHLNEIPPEIDRVVFLREGRVVADGAKRSVITVENLEKTFGVAARLAERDGYYFVYPPDRTRPP